MLKRSKLLVAFLAVTVICASVGFAAVSDTLTANGTWNMVVGGSGEGETDPNNPFQKDFEADVYFSAVEIDVDNTTVTTTGDLVTVAVVEGATETYDVKDNINITVKNGAFNKVGDKLTVKATIINASTAQAAKVTIGTIKDTAVSAFASVVAEVSNEGTVAMNDGTVTLTITITLNKIPAENLDDVTFSVPVTAEALN